MDNEQEPVQVGPSENQDELYQKISEILPKIEANLRSEISQQLQHQYEQQLAYAIEQTQKEAQQQLQSIIDEIHKETLDSLRGQLRELDEKNVELDGKRREIEEETRIQVQQQVELQYQTQKENLVKSVVDQITNQGFNSDLEGQMREKMRAGYQEKLREEMAKREQAIKISYKQKIDAEKAQLKEFYTMESKNQIDQQKSELEKQKHQLARLKASVNVKLQKLEEQKRKAREQSEPSEKQYWQIIENLQQQISDLSGRAITQISVQEIRNRNNPLRVGSSGGGLSNEQEPMNTEVDVLDSQNQEPNWAEGENQVPTNSQILKRRQISQAESPQFFNIVEQLREQGDGGENEDRGQFSAINQFLSENQAQSNSIEKSFKQNSFEKPQFRQPDTEITMGNNLVTGEDEDFAGQYLNYQSMNYGVKSPSSESSKFYQNLSQNNMVSFNSQHERSKYSTLEKFLDDDHLQYALPPLSPPADTMNFNQYFNQNAKGSQEKSHYRTSQDYSGGQENDSRIANNNSNSNSQYSLFPQYNSKQIANSIIENSMKNYQTLEEQEREILWQNDRKVNDKSLEEDQGIGRWGDRPLQMNRFYNHNDFNEKEKQTLKSLEDIQRQVHVSSLSQVDSIQKMSDIYQEMASESEFDSLRNREMKNTRKEIAQKKNQDKSLKDQYTVLENYLKDLNTNIEANIFDDLNKLLIQGWNRLHFSFKDRIDFIGSLQNLGNDSDGVKNSIVNQIEQNKAKWDENQGVIDLLQQRDQLVSKIDINQGFQFPFNQRIFETLKPLCEELLVYLNDFYFQYNENFNWEGGVPAQDIISVDLWEFEYFSKMHRKIPLNG